MKILLPLVALLALTLASGCSGTRQAYQAADGVGETAYVIAEHYAAVIEELNDLADQGALSQSAIRHAQDIVRRTDPVIRSLRSAAEAYENVQNADTEAALEEAINEAAVALSDLIDAVKGRQRTGIQPPQGMGLYREVLAWT